MFWCKMINLRRIICKVQWIQIHSHLRIKPLAKPANSSSLRTKTSFLLKMFVIAYLVIQS